jgi:hypothetical protein
MGFMVVLRCLLELVVRALLLARAADSCALAVMPVALATLTSVSSSPTSFDTPCVADSLVYHFSRLFFSAGNVGRGPQHAGSVAMMLVKQAGTWRAESYYW